MLDAAAEPPEINSHLVHDGAGPAPLAGAALAYATAAAQDEANAAALMGILSAVRAAWDGAAADAAAAQLMPLINWFQMMAVNSAATATQLESVSAAITAAITSSPFPVRVHTNRATWATLNMTNFMGVNTPAIVAHDADYAEMWVRAASARAGSDAEATLATGTMVPWTPPPMPVNMGGLGSAAAHAVSTLGKGFTIPGDIAASVGREAGWDVILGSGLAGDGAWMGQEARPPGVLLTDAEQTGEQAGRDVGLAGRVAQPAAAEQVMQAPEQAMQSMGGQAGSMMSSATQPVAQLGQQVGQLGQAPTRMLQPLMSMAQMGRGLGGGTDPATAMGMSGMSGFTTGGGGLTGSLARPLGVGGGGMSAAGGGLRLPAAATSAPATPVAAPTPPTGAGGAGGARGAAPMGGSGMYGAPAHAARSERSEGSANKYADSQDLVAAAVRSAREGRVAG